MTPYEMLKQGQPVDFGNGWKLVPKSSPGLACLTLYFQEVEWLTVHFPTMSHAILAFCAEVEKRRFFRNPARTLPVSAIYEIGRDALKEAKEEWEAEGGA